MLDSNDLMQQMILMQQTHLETQKQLSKALECIANLNEIIKKGEVDKSKLGTKFVSEGDDLSSEKEQVIMKYKGITIHKHTHCNTWYTRFRVGKKQYYVSSDTQQGCYDKLKQSLTKSNVTQLLESQKYLHKGVKFIIWYERWLELYKIGKVSEETLRCYRSLIKKVPEDIQKMKMCDITLSTMMEVINACESSRQRQKLYDFLKMIYEKALDNEIIDKNIFKLIDKPKHKKVHSTALTYEEQAMLEDACNQIPSADVLLVAMYQGYRRGEVLGLTRDCIDFENKTITINKAWKQDNKMGKTKNDQSERTEPMFDKTFELLKKYRYLNPEERIFNLSIKQYETLLKKVKEKSNLNSVKMKDMRCTFITNCRNMNIPLHIIQAWVGHEIGSVVTASVYTSYNKGADAQYIDMVNQRAYGF